MTVRKNRSYTPSLIWKGLWGPKPLTVLNYSSALAREKLRNLLAEKRFDAVQLEACHLVSYIDVIKQAQNRPAVVLDWHNIESELMVRYSSETGNFAKKLVGQRTASLMQRTEKEVLGLCDMHVTVSDRDRHKLELMNPSAKIQVVPNGVDTQAFTLGKSVQPKNSILFVGSMDYHANIDGILWFASNIWPAIAKAHHHLTLKIVGRSPTPAIKALASDRIIVTGTVSDVLPYYEQALAVVVPLRVGGGTRLKILEAMSVGSPVVSTTLGAEGINVTDGHNILLADSEQAMSSAVSKIAGNPALGASISSAARRLVEAEYDWRSIGNKLYNDYQSVLAGREGLSSLTR